jgi:hypothetical protein
MKQFTTIEKLDTGILYLKAEFVMRCYHVIEYPMQLPKGAQARFLVS